MADTRKWKLLGKNPSPGNITIKFNNQTAFSGPLTDTDFMWHEYQGPSSIDLLEDKIIAAGTLTYTQDTDNAKVYSLVPVEITVESGSFGFIDFLWDYAPVINPALSDEEAVIATQGALAMKNASQAIKDAVLAKGGWYMHDPNLYFEGGQDSGDVKTRYNATLNGQPYDFDTNSPGTQNEDNNAVIALQAGDTFTANILILKSPTRM